MRMKTRVLLISLILLAVLTAMLLFAMTYKDDSGLAESFNLKKAEYDNYADAMNILIDRYAEPDVLTFEHIDIIDGYLDLYQAEKTAAVSFMSFVHENRAALESIPIDTKLVLARIEDDKKTIILNIAGFSRDLEMMNSSLMLAYSLDKTAKWESLKDRIKDILEKEQ